MTIPNLPSSVAAGDIITVDWGNAVVNNIKHLYTDFRIIKMYQGQVCSTNTDYDLIEDSDVLLSAGEILSEFPSLQAKVIFWGRLPSGTTGKLQLVARGTSDVVLSEVEITTTDFALYQSAYADVPEDTHSLILRLGATDGQVCITNPCLVLKTFR